LFALFLYFYGEFCTTFMSTKNVKRLDGKIPAAIKQNLLNEAKNKNTSLGKLISIYLDSYIEDADSYMSPEDKKEENINISFYIPNEKHDIFSVLAKKNLRSVRAQTFLLVHYVNEKLSNYEIKI